jgi:RNA recognition motif-containing protein
MLLASSHPLPPLSQHERAFPKALSASWTAATPFQETPMGKKLYVGNLSYDVTDSALQAMFEVYGTVQSAQIIMDRETNRSKGFGFVEMGSDQEAQAAIAGLSGKQSGGRALTVNEAKPREDRGGGGGRSGGRGGYGGGGGSRRY